ncbi:hypothetical protein [Clostridium botulinum]|uniref:Uncharacterized protein n=2 Tax=Clostridium botulinum TaxID=1491 RepID=C1FRC5_CLOBJ|nr:hypothetical protein [Clostridium botulinum]ACO86858.1 conserved hypothetical protein [Clostridium botulinum A2 str. Kyoto]AUN07445.1 hypothetical protein RSJ14_12365 [Clostridium botulinum]AUN18241.1 hypothetical protein B2M06_11795 [Clostridium botulinum]MBN3364280.1 hypothetical protein [Clostridium botulinum]MBN3368454.1 hypothetical protein [Clostridium botulinum]
MITVLVKELENKYVQETQSLKEENIILKFLLKECVKKSMDYKELLQESLDLLDKYQEEVEKLSLRTNLWADEAVRLYNEHGNLDKALRAVGKEIILYELNKNKGEM